LSGASSMGAAQVSAAVSSVAAPQAIRIIIE
jgi:hypothetical protein